MSNWCAITVLVRASQPLSQTELAAELEVEGATVVSMLDLPTKAGLAAPAAISFESTNKAGRDH
jgi:hypothetical protein